MTSGAAHRPTAAEVAGRPPTSRALSAWMGSIEGQTWWAHEDRAPHLAASTVKLPLAVAAHRLHEQGVLDLDAGVRVHEDFDSVVPGARFTMDPARDQDPETWAERGADQVLRTLLRRAVVRSGNLASNLVLEQVGLAAVAEVLEEAGCCERTVVARGIEDVPAREAGLENIVAARDLGLLVAGIASRRLGGPAAMAAVEADLLAQTYRDGIPAGLPAGVVVANKTGWIGGVTHDVALVRPDDHPPFVLVVLTRHGASESAGDALVARVAARAWARLEERAGRPLQTP